MESELCSVSPYFLSPHSLSPYSASLVRSVQLLFPLSLARNVARVEAGLEGGDPKNTAFLLLQVSGARGRSSTRLR